MNNRWSVAYTILNWLTGETEMMTVSLPTELGAVELASEVEECGERSLISITPAVDLAAYRH